MRIDAKPFSDVRVRQAFRLIVDRPQMITQAYDGFGWLGNDMYAPFDPGTPKLPQRHQDLAQAKSLLKAAGYDGDLTVQLTTSDAVGESDEVAAAQVFAEQAKGAGVKVNVNKVDASIFYGKQYLTWPFAQDFWYTRNYLAQAGHRHDAGGALQREPLEERQVARHRQEGLQDGRQDEAQRADRARRRRSSTTNGGYIIWAFNNQVDAYSTKLSGRHARQVGRCSLLELMSLQLAFTSLSRCSSRMDRWTLGCDAGRPHGRHRDEGVIACRRC